LQKPKDLPPAKSLVDDLWGLAFKVARYVIDGVPASMNNALVWLNEFRTSSTDRFFFSQLVRVASGKGEIHRFSATTILAPPWRSANLTSRFQGRDVSTNCRN